MAIAFDNAKDYTFTSTNDSTTFTVGTGENRYLLATTKGDGGQVTQISYNGVNMSKIYSFVDPISDGNGNNIYVWGLANPASGTNTFQLTNGSGSGSIGIVSYSGVDQGIQPEGTVITNYSNNGTNNTQVTQLSSTVTTTTDNAWAVMFVRGSNALRTFVSSDGNLRTTGVFIFGDGCEGIIDSGAVSPAGNKTLTASWDSGSGFISEVIMSLKPAQDFVPQMIII